MKISGERIEPDPRLWRQLEIRRLANMLVNSKHTPRYLKLSRRSRRRWRGQGGVWDYSPVYRKMLLEAIDAYR